MNIDSKTPMELFFEKHILPHFISHITEIVWEGESELDTERSVFYFHCSDVNYLLVRELYHGVADHKLVSLITDNAVLPHQKIVIMHPKQNTHTYVHVSKDELKHNQNYTGDYSLFRID
ncbi:hypothetical protein H7142_02860 [Candidatus Saccharibacteria bacterium]|nr:hypothetical protein [Candidatus Saccharibacteria bacterium]